MPYFATSDVQVVLHFKTKQVVSSRIQIWTFIVSVNYDAAAEDHTCRPISVNSSVHSCCCFLFVITRDVASVSAASVSKPRSRGRLEAQ